MTADLSFITVNSRRFDGTIKRSWKVRPLHLGPDRVELVGEFEFEVEHPEIGLIGRGTVSYEYFWFDRWYNIFRFHEPAGDLKCYYCNVILPPELTGPSLDYVDLDLDILIWPNGSFQVLDEAEFEENITALRYPPDVVGMARKTVEELTHCIDSGEFPSALVF